MKRLLPILAVIPLALAACTDAEDAAAPISSEVATTTSSTAPEGPVEVDLGEPIHLVQDANGPRDITVTLDDINASTECSSGFNDYAEPQEGGYYITITGSMDVKESSTNFSVDETWMTGTTEDGHAIQFEPAFGCNHASDAKPGYQSFDDPINQGQKAKGILEFWAPELPATLTYKEPYEPVAYQWGVAPPKDNAYPTATAQEQQDTAAEEQPAAALDPDPAPAPDPATIPYADGGTCPAYKCGYGHDENGNPNPSSGEIQTKNGCDAGYINDPELCAAVADIEVP